MPETPCPRRAAVPCRCRFALLAPHHHDRLVRVDVDVSVALDLFELATTWEELDYSDQALVPPCDWLDFAAGHPWHDQDLAERLFGVAVDVALRRGAPVTDTPLARVLAPAWG
ncbi:MAG: hypothetical protein QOI99_319 [Actinomycetota bacterium]|nr:hypothetical protein [Actinomycetota bacterium]